MTYLFTIIEENNDSEPPTTLEIYRQRVPIIDLPAVIQAINKKRRVDAGVPRKAKPEAK